MTRTTGHDGYADGIATRMIGAMAALAVFFLPATGFADDTELYLTQSDIACEVNALFVIDTSGSMGAEVETQATWDPEQDFGGACETDRLYLATPGVTPNCSTAPSFPKSQNFCQSSQRRLDASGSYTDSLRTFRDNRWRDIDFANANVLENQPVDCEADGDGQGEINGSEFDDGRYAVNGPAGPWSADASLQIGWPARQVAIYDGNWLNWSVSPLTERRAKLDIVKEVSSIVLDSIDDVNVGVMQFNGDRNGGPVIHAVAPVADNRDSLREAIDGLQPSGTTPLSETLYEAGQYYAGRLVDFGNLDPANRSVAESRLNGDPNATAYRSPITEPGQLNHIVLLTDGEPQDDNAADAKITGLPGYAAATGRADCTPREAAAESNDGHCLDDMAAYLNNRDLLAGLELDQSVFTHTIGFDVDLELLQTTATRGGGKYLLANDSASLISAITEFVQDIRQSAGTFASPTLPVDAFSVTESQREVFISLFQPTNRFRWPGNVKKYAVATTFQEGRPTVSLVDANNRPAIDPITGTFADGAQSFWSDEIDGNKLTAGGAASRLPDPQNRVILTNSGMSRQALASLPPNLPPSVVGAPGAAERDLTIRWALGEDALDEDADGDTTEPRMSIGDPLHVSPVRVTYGTSDDASRDVVYVSTNDGYLHAIDAESGRELWAYIPERLLNRLYELSVNALTPSKQYGLDGEISIVVRNSDGRPGISDEEDVILLFGMRRGGNAVFAVDVTDPGTPELLFVIDNDVPAFRDLGQTWSTPVATTVDVEGTRHLAVLFAGGYDSSQDNEAFHTDTVGNSLYMVSLNRGSEGQLLWRAGNPATAQAAGPLHLALEDMEFSIPSTLNVIDFFGDGLADRIYVGDMGGQLWRFDIFNGADAEDLVRGGVMATLGGAAIGDNDPSPTAVRRFYNRPDVVFIEQGNLAYFAINIGSGYRAHPLNTEATDMFFSIRDKRPFARFSEQEYAQLRPFTVNDLRNIQAQQAVVLPEDNGWRLSMTQSAGEKILGPSVTFGGVTAFTSFSPVSGNSCRTSTGLNRLYRVSVIDGSAVTNLDVPVDEDDPIQGERFVELDVGGIAPPPQVVFVAESDVDGDEGDDGNDTGTTQGDRSGFSTVFCTSPGEACARGGGVDWFRTFWAEEETFEPDE